MPAHLRHTSSPAAQTPTQGKPRANRPSRGCAGGPLPAERGDHCSEQCFRPGLLCELPQLPGRNRVGDGLDERPPLLRDFPEAVPEGAPSAPRAAPSPAAWTEAVA